MIDYAVSRSSVTNVRIERGSSKAFVQMLSRHRSSFFLIDDGVLDALGEAVDSLNNDRRLILPAGERNKDLNSLDIILRWMQQGGFNRRDTLIAIGGGVILDIGGFAASIYLRGIRYMLLPSTLIAQVDAAIGGKVGINFGSAKNSVGSFWHPSDVLIDPNLITTISARDYTAGLAECVKVSCCQESGEFFRFMEESSAAIVARDQAAVDRTIRESVSLKWSLLEPDPFEDDLDRVLNLGHTVAHALEHATGYRNYRHGEAVSIGVATAARYGERRGILSLADSHRIQRLLDKLGLPLFAPSTLVKPIRASLEGVLRVRGGKIRYVVPSGVGAVEIVEPDSCEDFLREAFGGQQVRH